MTAARTELEARLVALAIRLADIYVEVTAE